MKNHDVIFHSTFALKLHFHDILTTITPVSPKIPWKDKMTNNITEKNCLKNSTSDGINKTSNMAPRHSKNVNRQPTQLLGVDTTRKEENRNPDDPS